MDEVTAAVQQGSELALNSAGFTLLAFANASSRPMIPEGCTNPVPTCCRLIIFVQQPAKSISPTHPCVNGKRCFLELFSLRWLKLQRPVRSLPVVMANVDLEDALEVATGEDEQPVQALGPDGSDPSLTERVGTRCPDGSADHVEPLGCEHVIERTAELGVKVMDEKPQRLFSFVEVEREVPRLLDHPSAVRGGRATGEVDTPGGELDEYQHVDPLEPHGFKGEEVTRHHARSLLGKELSPGRAASAGRRPEVTGESSKCTLHRGTRDRQPLGNLPDAQRHGGDHRVSGRQAGDCESQRGRDWDRTSDRLIKALQRRRAACESHRDQGLPAAEDPERSACRRSGEVKVTHVRACRTRRAACARGR